MGGGGREREGGVRDPNLQVLSLENHQDDLCLPSHFKTKANGTVCVCVMFTLSIDF